MDMNPPYGGGRGFGGGGFLGYHEGGPGAFGWTVFALQLVLVLGVAWLLASVVLRGRLGRRAVAAPLATGGPAGDPLGVLRMRYARGELNRDEYLQASTDLGAPPGADGETGQ